MEQDNVKLILDRLDGLDQKVTTGFEAIDEKFDEMHSDIHETMRFYYEDNRRFIITLDRKYEKRTEEMMKNMDFLAKQFVTHDTELLATVPRFDRLEARVEKLEKA